MIAKQEIQMFSKIHRILLRTNDFIYIRPHPALRNQISNYTITFPNKHILSDRYTVIPHGSATLVFSYDSSGVHSNLFGPMTKPCVVGSLANSCDMLLIIEFQPAGFYALTGMNQKELTNQTISFDLIHPKLERWMVQALDCSNQLEECIDHLDRILLENVHSTYPAAFQIARGMVLEKGGNISYKELSSSVYYSERHLNRLFEEYLGMNAKTFSRMIRINKAIRFLQNPHYNSTHASYKAGFYDLPHFIHDFKWICGITPQEYRNNMSDFYSEIAKF